MKSRRSARKENSIRMKEIMSLPSEKRMEELQRFNNEFMRNLLISMGHIKEKK